MITKIKPSRLSYNAVVSLSSEADMSDSVVFFISGSSGHIKMYIIVTNVLQKFDDVLQSKSGLTDVLEHEKWIANKKPVQVKNRQIR
jgi:hypothetical protein